MSDAAATARDAGLKATTIVAYGLFLLAPFNGLTAIAGVILVYVRRDEMRGTVWESHGRNLVRVFWIGALLAVLLLAALLQGAGGLLFELFRTDGDPSPALIGGLAVLVPVLALAALVFTIWYLYRVLRGLLRALDGLAG
ncbi:MAG: hypothetical protein WDN03_00975 [Rhizomicrobium sp.]